MRDARIVQTAKAIIFVLLAVVFVTGAASSQTAANSEGDQLSSRVDKIVQEVLASTGVPSASVAVVKSSRVAYLHAYGNAQLDPKIPARTDMSYSIGSVSKQFTAAAVLFLVEQHKLSLDDPVSRYFPTLTRANEVTIRELLSHTSGYQDYWPQDYVFPAMLNAVSEDQILNQWARKPLDFEPGTKWQYSNTNFVIAGLIVEKVSGMPFMSFLHEHIFAPLDMKDVANVDQDRPQATGYIRYAVGPPHVAPKEGKGWLFAAGELGMPVGELAKWDISMIRQSLLQPSSYKVMQTEILLKNGLGARYGLGIGVASESGHRALEHGGEISGFTTENMVFPDDGAAVVVITNQSPASAAGDIAHRISALLFSEDGSTHDQNLRQARDIYEKLQKGTIERSLFTENANSYFTDEALKDFATSLGPLGPPQDFSENGHQERGGMTYRGYKVKYEQRSLDLWFRIMPDGKIEECQVKAD